MAHEPGTPPPSSAVAHPPSSIHSRPSAVVRPSRDWWWSSVALRPRFSSSARRHTAENITTYRGHGPVGLAPANTANRDGVHGFRAGARSGHRTRTRATRTPDTAGSAKPVLYPRCAAYSLIHPDHGSPLMLDRRTEDQTSAQQGKRGSCVPNALKHLTRHSTDTEIRDPRCSSSKTQEDLESPNGPEGIFRITPRLAH